MSHEKLRWGILGTAKIARKNWRGIGHSGNSTVTAVASRDRERSRRFIAECQADLPMDAVPEAFGSYEAMLASGNVDAVYVPLPTALRRDWVVRAAEAGKHVLCEKPCAASVGELEEMIGACRRNRVQFMDGVMFMHHPRLPRLREKLDNGITVGAVRRIVSAHDFGAPPEFFTRNIRSDGSLEPHGCLGDLGWYSIRLSLWVMNWQLPRKVTGRVLAKYGRPDNSAPVPTEFSGELEFEGGASAGFHCSFLPDRQQPMPFSDAKGSMPGREQWAVISGTRGNIQIPDFVVPAGEAAAGSPTAQESNMCRNFADQVRSGAVSEFWPEIALKTQRVMMACYESALAGA